MFLSSSYPEINTSPYSDKSQDLLEKSQNPLGSSFLDDRHYEGDRSDSTDLSNSDHFLTSSLPDIGTPSSNRKKKRRKKRSSETDNLLANKHQARRASSLTSIRTIAVSAKTDSALPPLNTHCDLKHAIGRRRGVAGSSKDSSYLDVILFTLFFFTDICDEWLLDEGRSKGFPTPRGKEVRSVLRKEIIYSLRTSYFCPAEKVTKLYKLLFGEVTEPAFIEVRSFLLYFFESVLNVTESTHFTNGTSELVYTLIPSGNTRPLTVQELFQNSLKCSGNEELQLLSIPNPALILSLSNPLGVPHSALIPNIQLDISNFILQISDDTDESKNIESSKYVPPSKGRQGNQSPLCRYFKTFCQVVFEYMQNLVIQFPGLFNSATTLDDSWATSSFSSYLITPEDSRTAIQLEDSHENTLESGSTLLGNFNKEQSAKVLLDLYAVVCLGKEKDYTVFVRCGQNPRRGWAPWVFFDPLDQGTPLVRKVDDCGKWLSRLENNPSKVKSMKKIIPPDIQKLMTESTLFIYNIKPIYESQTTLFSFLNETEI